MARCFKLCVGFPFQTLFVQRPIKLVNSAETTLVNFAEATGSVKMFPFRGTNLKHYTFFIDLGGSVWFSMYLKAVLLQFGPI